MGNARIPTTTKNPILLLPSHVLTRMLITYYHRKLHHAGLFPLLSALQRDYLIPKIRRTVKNIISGCVICKRHQGRHYAYPTMPDLPSERVNRSRPFENTGLDYFGPLQVRSQHHQNQKVWVCLFTCMATRAIHLELVTDNSTTQFLLAFRGFISRRGAPSNILSDNAPNFKLGREVLINELRQISEDKVVKDFSTNTGLQWRFITPLSPWKGGFYERLVGSVKSALKKTTHRNLLDIWNLQTLLTEVESTLNTRPLTPVTSNNVEGPYILRPIDLLTPNFSLGHLGTPLETVTTKDPFSSSDSQEHLIHQYRTLRESLNMFWDIWHKEYLRAVAERNQIRLAKQQSSSKQPQIGDIVFIELDNAGRSQWPLGVVIELNKSTDGAIRSVKVRTAKRHVLDRSTNQLIPLEVAAAEESSTKIDTPTPPTRIQPPRAAKKTILR